MTDASGERICSCGLPMSRNPHPLAGDPTMVGVEIGHTYVCIPCTVKSRSAWATRARRGEDELEKMQDTIAAVLCSQALADHLGDVRDAEAKLWELLGVPELPFDDPAWDSDSAWRITKARLVAAGASLPEHLRDDDDDDDDD